MISHPPEDIIFRLFIIEMFANFVLFSCASTPFPKQSTTSSFQLTTRCPPTSLPSASLLESSTASQPSSNTSTSSSSTSSSSSTLKSPSSKVPLHSHRQMVQRQLETYPTSPTHHAPGSHRLGIRLDRTQPNRTLRNDRNTRRYPSSRISSHVNRICYLLCLFFHLHLPIFP